MKITLLELKRIIRETISECYGWPVESEKPLYGVKSAIGKPSKVDPKNSPLRRKGTLKESFSKITTRELDEWRSGNWGYLSETGKPPEDEDKEKCNECGSGMNECDCS